MSPSLYSNVVKSTSEQLTDFNMKWDKIEKGVDVTTNNPNLYETSKERSITIWTQTHLGTADVIEASDPVH